MTLLHKTGGKEDVLETSSGLCMVSGNERRATNAGLVLAILFLGNLLNFFDRAVPAVLVEPIRAEWNLDDLHIGLIIAAFTGVFAIAGIPLGLLADSMERRKVMGWGLTFWSAFMGLGAVSWSFGAFLFTRMCVGIGEASYLPAANSMIGDLFPANRRSRATGLFMLGLPLGLLLAFFTIGHIVETFGSWRAAFALAAVAGFAIAGLMFLIPEPERSAAKTPNEISRSASSSVLGILNITTMRWIIVAGITSNISFYATNGFLVALMQRYFGLDLKTAAISAGIVVGVTGLFGLTFGGWAADYLNQRINAGRLVMGAICFALATPLTLFALLLPADHASLFVALFGFGWLFQYAHYVSLYPAIQEIVEPKLRSTAMGVFLAALSIPGGVFGPILIGFLSDHLSILAMQQAGVSEMTDHFRALGLHDAMFLIPATLAITGVAILMAARSQNRAAQSVTKDLPCDGSPQVKTIAVRNG
ncbi:spinster family MFS transporter [Mesorhizobium sp. ASY16-5R]|uniref:spinster family MFS transporter n=1 Tax=Mesorhizobium sp. ASY16-5R TaxID=3445772 RepID=UPI003F9F8D23